MNLFFQTINSSSIRSFLFFVTILLSFSKTTEARNSDDEKCETCSKIAKHINSRLLQTEDIKDSNKRMLKVMEGVCGSDSTDCPDMLSKNFEALNNWFSDGMLKGVPVEEIVCPSLKCNTASSSSAAAAIEESDDIEIEIEDESEKRTISPPPPPSSSKKVVNQKKKISPIKSLLNFLPTINIVGLLPAASPAFLRPLTDFLKRILGNFSRSINLGKEMFSELIPLARSGNVKSLFEHVSSKIFWERYWRVIMGMLGFVYLIYGIFESIYLIFFPSSASLASKKTPARRTVSRKSTTSTTSVGSAARPTTSPRPTRSKGN